jgi:plastocyanin
MSVAKNLDTPVDANQCTDNVCTAGVPSLPNSAAGLVCTQMGGKVCSGAGACVGCVVGADCTSGVCTANVCAAASCTDGVMNGTETGLDCGGSCAACLGAACTTASNCASGACTGNVCATVNGCDMSTATKVTVTSTIVTFANGNLTYAPKCIKVTQGTVVTFNGNFVSHPLLGGEVVGGVGTPASGGPFMTLVNTGTSTPYTMSTTGTFPYYCTAHASLNMDGVVFVVP